MKRQNLTILLLNLKKDSQSISKNRLNLMQYTACLVFNPDTVKKTLLSSLSPVYTFTIFSTIHHDSPRFLMVRKIGMDRGESWRKVEIFSISTILVRMSTILVRCL